MVGTVRHAKLETPTARRRLKRGRQPHWQAIIPGRVHLGYQRWPGEAEGRWILRRFIGSQYRDGKYLYNKYAVTPLGRADDAGDGMSYEAARAAAAAMVEVPTGAVLKLTVRQAVERYVEFKRTQGQSITDLVGRARVHILPTIGDLVVAALTAERLRRWLATMAATPAQTRPKAGKPQYKPEPMTDDAVRARRATANRTLNMLKAALNHAYDEGHISNRDAWGRKLKPFRDVAAARVRYLTIEEAQRLINAADAEFRPLVRAALETGARYGELTRLEVSDFNGDAGTLAIRKSKSGKARHVVLTQEGSAFFRDHCAGRAGGALMFVRADGPWKKSSQSDIMPETVARARITPPISFHGLRHTWASLAVMNGVPLMVVAKNLGHANTRMVEKHYGHLAPSFISDAIRAGAPKYGIAPSKRVVPLR